MAFKLGDPTAKRLGRVTLNPIPHMDPIGTLLLPIFGYFVGGFLIGWGVPVPFDPRYLKNFKRDVLLIALAGPVSNLLLAFIIAVLLHGMAFVHPQWFNPNVNYNSFTLMTALIKIFYLNLALFIFNLIPIHPLDGGKVMYGLLPHPYADRYDQFVGRYGLMLLFVIFFTKIDRVLVWYPVERIAGWLL